MGKKLAIMSVSDKSGLVEFARGLCEIGFEIVATGGTQRVLRDNNIQVTPVEDVTHFREILDGRVKTLHPGVLAGILAIRSRSDHMRTLEELGIRSIDLVVVNLYPFEQVISEPDVEEADAIENIDIGGPTLIRAAAKNFADVGCVTSPGQYQRVLEEFRAGNGELSLKTRRVLAYEAFLHVARYDAVIERYFAGLAEEDSGAEGLPEMLGVFLEKNLDLRYGENPHQRASFYVPVGPDRSAFLPMEKLQGKELSFNNIADCGACYELVAEFDEPACVIVKHMNPCGAAIGKSSYDAYRRAYAADPVSSFGGIVGFNVPIDAKTAEALTETFLEVVVAPDFHEEALKVLAKKRNLRVIKSPLPAAGASNASLRRSLDYKRTPWGILVQDTDVIGGDDSSGWKVVTSLSPSEDQWKDIVFAWKVVKHVKSNAIVLVRDQATLGVGAGQMNRVGSARIAIAQAGDEARGAVLASDGFLPMRDTVDAAAEAGISVIVQPGGSIRDEDSIQACEEHKIAMIFTGRRHFRH